MINFLEYKMILEGYLLYQEIQKKQRQNEKNNEFALIVQDNNTSTGESSVASIIFLITLFVSPSLSV